MLRTSQVMRDRSCLGLGRVPHHSFSLQSEGSTVDSVFQDLQQQTQWAMREMWTLWMCANAYSFPPPSPPCLFLLFKTRFLCVALAVLELKDSPASATQGLGLKAYNNLPWFLVFCFVLFLFVLFSVSHCVAQTSLKLASSFHKLPNAGITGVPVTPDFIQLLHV